MLVLTLVSIVFSLTVTPLFAMPGGGSLCCEYCSVWVGDPDTGCCSDSPGDSNEPYLSDCQGIAYCSAEVNGPTDCHPTCTGAACMFV